MRAFDSLVRSALRVSQCLGPPLDRLEPRARVSQSAIVARDDNNTIHGWLLRQIVCWKSSADHEGCVADNPTDLSCWLKCIQQGMLTQLCHSRSPSSATEYQIPLSCRYISAYNLTCCYLHIPQQQRNTLRVWYCVQINHKQHQVLAKLTQLCSFALAVETSPCNNRLQ